MKNLSAAAFLLCLAPSVFAQAAGGVATISGVVRDQTGAVVPNANVQISTKGLGVVRTLTTNESGIFSAPALTPAPDYEVKVTATGFNEWDAKGLALQIGQVMDLRVDLTVGQTTTAVEVTAAAPLVEDTKTDVSTVVNTQQILDLPINGRRVDSFVLLTPGVTNDATFGLLTFRGVAGNNTFLLDGNDNTEQFYNENAGRTRIASQVSQDAVQEFEVVSADYSAEYGRAMGGIVNTLTKSGTNEYHGTGFWFFRNTALDARDPFSAIIPYELRNQVGATFGGPIVKNKLFFFLSTDITRRNFPMVDTITQAGVIDPINKVWIGCAAPATPAQCSAINAVLPRFFGNVPRTASNDLYFAKLDYHFSERNTFSASFNYLRWLSPNGIQTSVSSTSGSAINGNGDDSVLVRDGRFTWTSVPTSTFVNEFRFGWAADRQADTFDNAELGSGLGLLDVAVAGAPNLGPAAYLPRVEPSESRFQFVDNATWTKGTHTLKFGFDAASTEDYIYYYVANDPYGAYTYQTVTAFAQDYSGNTTGDKHWQRYTQQFGNPVVDFRINEYAAYLQDEWRATKNLTVTLGARYEYSKAPTPPITNPDWPQTGKIHTSPTNLAPRVGIAWRLNDKTVIRAGYGLFYARLIGSLVDNIFTGNGIYQTGVTLNNTDPNQVAAGPVFPNTLSSAPTGGSVAASTIQFAAPNLKTPYSEQGNFTVERQFGNSTALSAAYIWSRGAQLYGV
ncbi:MAG TPA: TonB-dependent receptor, partial [Bryobacteraceae bacterium]|nr:TonB-dependent receptor [Bryobacteraceae bacterium]